MKTTTLKVLTALALMLGATACHTMEGVGKDVEAGGEAVEESADKNRSY